MNDFTYTSQPKNVVKGAFRPNVLIRILRSVQAWNQRRLAVRELNAMSDSLLRDLGIERFQIADAVRRSGEFSELKPAKPQQIFTQAVTPQHKAAA